MTRSSPPARRMASDWPAIGRSRPFAWKRAIAPGAPRSAPTTLRSLRDSARFVKLKTNLPFRGRAALEAQRAAPLPRLLTGFTAASDVILFGRETIFRNGERVGWLASGGYGHTVCKAIGYGYVRRAAGVDAEFVMSGDYTLEVAGEHVPAEPFLKPLYDPAGLRVRA